MTATRNIRRNFLRQCSDEYLAAFRFDAAFGRGFFADKDQLDRGIWKASIAVEQQLRAGEAPGQLQLDT